MVMLMSCAVAPAQSTSSFTPAVSTGCQFVCRLLQSKDMDSSARRLHRKGRCPRLSHHKRRANRSCQPRRWDAKLHVGMDWAWRSRRLHIRRMGMVVSARWRITHKWTLHTRSKSHVQARVCCEQCRLLHRRVGHNLLPVANTWPGGRQLASPRSWKHSCECFVCATSWERKRGWIVPGPVRGA